MTNIKTEKIDSGTMERELHIWPIQAILSDTTTTNEKSIGLKAIKKNCRTEGVLYDTALSPTRTVVCQRCVGNTTYGFLCVGIKYLNRAGLCPSFFLFNLSKRATHTQAQARERIWFSAKPLLNGQIHDAASPTTSRRLSRTIIARRSSIPRGYVNNDDRILHPRRARADGGRRHLPGWVPIVPVHQRHRIDRGQVHPHPIRRGLRVRRPRRVLRRFVGRGGCRRRGVVRRSMRRQRRRTAAGPAAGLPVSTMRHIRVLQRLSVREGVGMLPAER